MINILFDFILPIVAVAVTTIVVLKLGDTKIDRLIKIEFSIFAIGCLFILFDKFKLVNINSNIANIIEFLQIITFISILISSMFKKEFVLFLFMDKKTKTLFNRMKMQGFRFNVYLPSQKKYEFFKDYKSGKVFAEFHNSIVRRI
jgi:hypothetical protein